MSGNLPFISCKCITYGRVDTLEESLNAFLKQDYPADKCELVIVNDYPMQKLRFNHPQVRIHNMDFTFSTIGEKENYATDLCMGDIICQWDDDDVAMPWHLNNVAKYFTDDVNILHWNPGVFYNGDSITDITWIGNSGIVFRKSAWEAIGHHPIENAGYDMTFIERLHAYGGRLFATPPKEEASTSRPAIKVPDSYGWQADNTYVYAGRIFSHEVCTQVTDCFSQCVIVRN